MTADTAFLTARVLGCVAVAAVQKEMECGLTGFCWLRQQCSHYCSGLLSAVGVETESVVIVRPGVLLPG